MVFAGIKNENETRDLWAYLKQFDADGREEVSAGRLTCIKRAVPRPRQCS